jgi:hypothetical protein
LYKEQGNTERWLLQGAGEYREVRLGCILLYREQGNTERGLLYREQGNTERLG